MCQASWSGRAETPTRSAVLGRRAFFVPSAKCQARVLECQALELNPFRVGGSGIGGILYWMLKVFSPNPEPRTPNQKAVH